MWGFGNLIVSVPSGSRKAEITFLEKGQPVQGLGGEEDLTLSI